MTDERRATLHTRAQATLDYPYAHPDAKAEAGEVLEVLAALETAEAVAEAAAAFVAAAAQASETPTGTFGEWGAKLAARREALEGLRAAVARWENEAEDILA
jgi:hypothetical protein